MGVGFAVAFIAIGAAIIFGVQRAGHSASPVEKAGLENPANPSQQKVTNPLQKYVEVVGIRLVTEKQKPVAKFLVVNHSSGEIAELEANVNLWASTARSDEDAIGSFSFKVSGLAAEASQEITAPLKTKLKMYELPDWQNATTDLQITSPLP